MAGFLTTRLNLLLSIADAVKLMSDLLRPISSHVAGMKLALTIVLEG